MGSETGGSVSVCTASSHVRRHGAFRRPGSRQGDRGQRQFLLCGRGSGHRVDPQQKEQEEGKQPDSVLEFGNLDRKRLGLLAAAGFGLAVFVSAVITVAPFPQSLMESYRSSSAGLREGRDRLLAMATTLVLAPAAEEIVFRGYMLGRFLSWFTQRQAVFLSAAVFALCHVSLLWMIYACFMGLLLAWVSIREDNTVYSIALHIGFNSSIVLTCLIGGEDSLPVILLGGAALILGVTALDLYRREEIK